jgi:Helix-turn-helix domain
VPRTSAADQRASPGRRGGGVLHPSGRMHLDGGALPTAAETGDAALIQRAKAGDHQAYAQLVRRYSQLAHRAATLIAGPDEAEDAAQTHRRACRDGSEPSTQTTTPMSPVRPALTGADPRSARTTEFR